MSNLVIEVVNANVVQKTNKAGKPYNIVDLAYKNQSFGGKIEGKQIMDFAEKAAFATISNAPAGSVFTVERQKDNNGFWKWVSVTEGANAAPAAKPAFGVSAPAPTSKTPKSTYETPEERAARQVMIVRQSSISSAVALAAANAKTKVHPEEIIEVAKKFEAYVMGHNEPTLVATDSAMSGLIGLEDDIPA